jgi:hypothetical protein
MVELPFLLLSMSDSLDYMSVLYIQWEIRSKFKEENRLPLSQIPARLYSEICYDLDRATANRIWTEENWKQGR